MQTPRYGLGMSQSGSCTQNTTKNLFHFERLKNIKETYLNESSHARTEIRALKEINLALISSSSSPATSKLHRRCQHEGTNNNLAPVSGVIEPNNSIRKKRRHYKISTLEKLTLSGGKQEYDKTFAGVSRHRFKLKTHHYADSQLQRETHYKKSSLIDPHSLRPRELINASKVNEEMQNDYIKSNSSSEKPSYVISSKAQHTSRSRERSGVTIRLADPFRSQLSVEVQISGSLSFNENISEKPCSNNVRATFTTYKNNIAKRDNLSPDVLTQRRERSKRISKQLCYCSKVSTNNSITRTSECEGRHLIPERQSFNIHRDIPNNPRRKKNVAYPKLQDEIRGEGKHRNEVQIFYVFDKPFQRPPITKTVPGSLDCSAICQTDPLKSATGIIKKLYHTFLESTKDAPRIAPCGKISKLCQGGKRKGNRKKRGSFFKRRKPAVFEEKYTSQDAVEKCANPATHCQADGIINENNALRKLFYTVIEPVECKCVSNKLSQIHKGPKLPCSCNGYRDTFKRFFHTVVEPVECRCVCNKLSQSNIKAPKLTCTCAEAETQSRKYSSIKKINFKRLFRKGTDLVECECVSNKLSQINMKDVKRPCTCAEAETQAHGYRDNFKSFFHTVIEPVKCKCVSNKLSQINMKDVKRPCTCAEAETQSHGYKDNFKSFFHTVIEPVECQCVSNKLSQINMMKGPEVPCTCRGYIDTLKKIFHTVVEPEESTCVCNKLSQIDMKASKLPYTGAKVETRSRKCRNLINKLLQPSQLSDNMPLVTANSTNSSTLCELKPPKNEDNIKGLFSILIDSHECGCVANKLRQIIPLINAYKPECTCAEAKTQSRKYEGSYQRAGREYFNRDIGTRKYEGSYQRAGREYFNRDIGTSGFPKYTNDIDNPESQEMPMEEMEYGNDELCCVSEKPATMNRRVGANGGYNIKCCHNTGPEMPKCTKSSTFCQLDRTRNKGEVLKKLCDAFLRPKVTQVDHKYINSSNLCRLGGIYNDIDIIENEIKYAPRCINSSSLCHIESSKNNNGVNKLFHFLEAKKNIPQAKCCKNRGTLCQGTCEDNLIKKLCLMIFEPNEQNEKDEKNEKNEKNYKNEKKQLLGITNKLKEINPLKNKKKTMQVNEKKQLLGKDNKLKEKKKKKKKKETVFTEATTQSRKYGKQQQRAGKEIFRRSIGTSGVPKQKSKKEKKKEEEPVYEIIDDETFVEPECTCTNKEIGIGTNCNFTLGWFKDRLAYGEPKPPDAINNTKIAIEQWNEAPLKQVKRKSTKIGASLKTNSKFNFFCTNTGTQSRKYRKRDLRAGRETFCKERQTSCIPKCKHQPPTDSNYNNVIVNQPLQPPAPDRKAVRLGSDCSFCFEFYRDVPPESPENTISKADESQLNKSILSKLRRRRATDDNVIETGVTGKSDEYTNTEDLALEESQLTKEGQEAKSTTKPAVVPKDKDKSTKEECRCESKKKKVKPSQISDQPLHMRSRVKFDFKFFKSISPPKRTNHILVDDIKEKCSCGVLTNESDINSSTQRIEEKSVASVSSKCDPSICDTIKSKDFDASSPNSDDLPNFADLVKTTKKCVLEFMSKKNFKRLINGMDKKPEVKKQLPLNLRYMSRKKPELVCEAKCKKMGEEPVDPDKPFRIGSSFSFGYDLKNVTPKHGEPEFEEKFPEAQDFKGSQLKTDFFRLIMGKIKKRVRPRVESGRTRLSSICDPRECKKLKEMNKTWFTYVLDNIRHPRPSNAEAETKKFITNILSGKAKKRKTCCKRKQDDNGLCSYILSNIKQERKTKPHIETDAERFFTEMLSESNVIRSCECKRGRRRRRRKQMPYGEYRAQFSAPNKLIGSDLSDSDWFPRSRKPEEKEKIPYRVKTDCCCSCDYKNKASNETDSESSHSESESMNYATT